MVKGSESSYMSACHPRRWHGEYVKQTCVPLTLRSPGPLIGPDGTTVPRHVSAIFTLFTDPSKYTHIMHQLLLLPQMQCPLPFYCALWDTNIHTCRCPAHKHTGTHTLFGLACSLWLWLICCTQAIAGREPGISRKDEPTIDKAVKRKWLSNGWQTASRNK